MAGQLFQRLEAKHKPEIGKLDADVRDGRQHLPVYLLEDACGPIWKCISLFKETSK